MSSSAGEVHFFTCFISSLTFSWPSKAKHKWCGGLWPRHFFRSVRWELNPGCIWEGIRQGLCTLEQRHCDFQHPVLMQQSRFLDTPVLLTLGSEIERKTWKENCSDVCVFDLHTPIAVVGRELKPSSLLLTVWKKIIGQTLYYFQEKMSRWKNENIKKEADIQHYLKTVLLRKTDQMIYERLLTGQSLDYSEDEK